MKKIYFILFNMGLAVNLSAQTDASVVSQKGMIAFTPLYQRWSSSSVELFSEASAALSFYQPLSREASVSLRSSFASTSGNTPALNSFNDMQLSGNYYVEDADLVFGLGLSIPTGKRNLTLDEFATSFLVSNSVFKLQVPHFGTGFNASPSVTWAFSFSEDIVGGVGALYQYRGSFVPIRDIGKYDPGDEICLTGGLDFRLTPTASLSFDAVFSIYGKDKLDDIEIFLPGNKLIGAVEFKQFFDSDEFDLRAIIRLRSGIDVPTAFFVFQTRERVEPNHYEFIASYRAEFNPSFAIRFLADARFSQETLADFTGMRLFGVGVAPEFTISDNVVLPLRTRFTFGKIKGDVSLNGLEAGLGVVVSY